MGKLCWNVCVNFVFKLSEGSVINDLLFYGIIGWNFMLNYRIFNFLEGGSGGFYVKVKEVFVVFFSG